MYLPKHFDQQDLASLSSLIKTYPLGTLVTQHEGALEANHIPFLLEGDATVGGKLVGHVAKGNPVWKDVDDSRESLVIFQGPEAYITPNWYPSKQTHHQVVPTYNYAVIHLYGRLSFSHDASIKRRIVEDLTQTMEQSRDSSWRVSDAPAEYIEKMIHAIVGLELTITRIQAKWKVSQNRDVTDRTGVSKGLSAHSVSENDRLMGIMVETGKGIGAD